MYVYPDPEVRSRLDLFKDYTGRQYEEIRLWNGLSTAP